MNALQRPLLATLLAAAALAAPAASRAALFEDDEARRAILELRQKVDAQRQAQGEELRRANEDNAMLRRSLLDLQGQIETLRAELARLCGQNETLAQDLANVQRAQKDIAAGVDERLRKFEPVKVAVDGREFSAEPAEQSAFEGALATFRRGEFPAAETAFAEFVKRYPQSGYRASALFWLGNAQYANRDYKSAIANFRALLQQAPDHPRAPEAVLSIANCQIELKDSAAARKTLADLVKAYPQSEAAVAAKERLARFR